MGVKRTIKDINIIVLLFALAYILFIGSISILKHYQFQTQTWDMGIYTQVIWNTTQGRLMQTTVGFDPSHLGVHFTPLWLALVPIYAAIPSPYVLLFLQTLILALGVWPLYLLTKKLLNKKIAFVFSVAYLLSPSLHAINLFDIHPIAPLVPLLITSIYFIETKNRLWASLFLVLCALVQEDAILVVFFVGLFTILKSGEPYGFKIFTKEWWTPERRFGLVTMILSFVYFFLVTKVFMPAFGGGLLRLDRYAELGGSFSGIIKTTLQNPDILFGIILTKVKLQYILWLLFPVLFLPLFSWRALLLLVPGLLENLLTQYHTQFSGFYQYDAMLVGSIFVAAVYGLSNLWQIRPKIIKYIVPALIFSSITAFLIASPAGVLLFPKSLFTKQVKTTQFREVISLIPDDVSVVANTNMVPHIINRREITMLGLESFEPDMLVIDGFDAFGFSDDTKFQEYIDMYLATNKYAVTSLHNRFFILHKKNVKLNTET
jgi:uncharacterized membrane protein